MLLGLDKIFCTYAVIHFLKHFVTTIDTYKL